MFGELLVRRIQTRLVAIGAGDGALEIVRDDNFRRRSKVAQRPYVRPDPVRQCLRPRRLGVGVVTRSQHGDEDLRRTDLTGTAVDDRHRRPGVVDEPDGQDARLLGGTG